MFKRDSNSPSTDGPTSKDMMRGFIGGFIGIALLSFLSKSTGAPLLMAPFGASCVLLFAAPHSPLAQPRNLLLGHILTSIIGLGIFALIGSYWFAMPLAVGFSIFAMQATKTLHPPAGANPLVIFLSGQAGVSFLFFPLIFGTVILLIVALIINNIGTNQKWPKETWLWKRSFPNAILGLMNRSNMLNLLTFKMENIMNLLQKNIGASDRRLRLIVGVVLCGCAIFGILGAWAYIGIIPLLTGLSSACPVYSLLGKNTLGK